MSFDRRPLECCEVNPIILFINTNECLTNPKRNTARACQCPRAFRHLILQRAIDSIAIEMHVTRTLRWPQKMLSVTEEIKIVRHVHPTGIGFGENAFGST